MSKNRVEGAIDKGVGAMKQAAGKATDNPRLEGEGAAQKAKGALKTRSAMPGQDRQRDQEIAG